MYEEEPLSIDIGTISRLDPNTCVFKEEDVPFPPSSKENFENFSFLEDNQTNLKDDMQRVLRQAMPNQDMRTGLDTERFMKELFEDKLEVDSCFSTG